MELGVCSRDRELLGHWSGLSVEWCVSRVRRRQLGGITDSPHLWLPASRRARRRLATMPAAAAGATLRQASSLEKGR